MQLSNAVVLGSILSVLCVSHAVAPGDSEISTERSTGRPIDLDVCVDTSIFVTGSFSNFGNWDVTLVGNLALCARLRGGVDAYDVSNPSAPELLDQFVTGGSVVDVVVQGSYAYLADWDFQANNRGVTVIDISDPANLQQVGINTLPVNPYDVELADSLLFVADGTIPGTVWIMSLANPTSPVVIGTYATPHTAKSVFVIDTLAYLALAQDGLAILDVSDPTQPELVGSLGGLSAAYDIFVTGGVAYVANLTFGLALVDVSDPTAPLLLSSYNTPGSANEVVVVGTVAHVADIDSGYLLLDVSNPADPEPILTMPSVDRTLGLTVDGSRTYAAEESAFTVYWFDSLGLCGDGGLGPCEECDDGNTVRGDGCGDCQVEPTLKSCPVTTIHCPNLIRGIDLQDSLLFVADDTSGFFVYNVRYGGPAPLLGRYDTPGNARRVENRGTIVAMADGPGGLRLLDVSDPTHPVQVGHFPTPTFASEVAWIDTMVYVFCTNRLFVINAAVPNDPDSVTSTPITGTVTDVHLAGQRAYLAGSSNGVYVLDISQPSTPFVIGNHSTPSEAAGIGASLVDSR